MCSEHHARLLLVGCGGSLAGTGEGRAVGAAGPHPFLLLIG